VATKGLKLDWPYLVRATNCRNKLLLFPSEPAVWLTRFPEAFSTGDRRGLFLKALEGDDAPRDILTGFNSSESSFKKPPTIEREKHRNDGTEAIGRREM
jgi:hypothetical protein